MGYEFLPRDRFIAALERRPYPGLVPTFELVFFLTQEVFGKVHPGHRNYEQWLQMTDSERTFHLRDMARLFVNTAERYEHSAILIQPNPWDLTNTLALVDEIRKIGGDRYCLMLHGDATYAIPDGEQMEELSIRMFEEPEGVVEEAKLNLDSAIKRAEKIKDHGGIDGFCLCSDYCFNSGPFLPLAWFDQFVTPFLHAQIRAYRSMGFYVIKHTDGNIMPILDRLVPEDPDARPHALHSLDPQGGVDIAEVVEKVGGKVALCGNVNCGLMQTGTDQEVLASARYAIEQGLKAPGYIFSTSNCVFIGMDLKRYEMVHEVWRREAVRMENADSLAGLVSLD